MANAIVTLKKGEGRYLKAGGPWIYDNEVARRIPAGTRFHQPEVEAESPHDDAR